VHNLALYNGRIFHHPPDCLSVFRSKADRVEYNALHDTLTGLGNRTCLMRDLENLIREERTFSVLFMDLDRFKQINDEYGHMTGDRYLKHFAGIIKEMFHEKGRAYRFGGDEFIVLYIGTVPESLMVLLKECQEWEQGAPCPFNQVSAGVLLCRPPHEGMEQILHKVDQLMYQNKLKRQQQHS
jgi:diguanylate cyclase (GGDEF)-like protein